MCSEVFAIPRARIPVIKFVWKPTGTKVDITLNNDLAVANTALLRVYAAIDPRLRQLVLLIKHWAKRRRVNDAYTGTLSSYAYCLMAIAHLQQRAPPVLPILQEGSPTRVQTIGKWNCDYFDDVAALQGWGAQNKEGLSELLASFFFHWAVVHDYRNAVLTIRRGAPMTKSDKGWCVCVCVCVCLLFFLSSHFVCQHGPRSRRYLHTPHPSPIKHTQDDAHRHGAPPRLHRGPFRDQPRPGPHRWPRRCRPLEGRAPPRLARRA